MDPTRGDLWVTDEEPDNLPGLVVVKQPDGRLWWQAEHSWKSLRNKGLTRTKKDWLMWGGRLLTTSGIRAVHDSIDSILLRIVNHSDRFNRLRHTFTHTYIYAQSMWH